MDSLTYNYKSNRMQNLAQQELSCCLCKSPFTINSQPRMMPTCQHNSCSPCLKQILASKSPVTIICKHCGHQQSLQESDLEYFPKNITLAKILKEKSVLALNNTQLESSRDTLESGSVAPIDKEYCQMHKKQLEIICLTDKEKICPHCALFGKHKDHQFKSVNEANELMNARKQEFWKFRNRKDLLDAKMNSTEFREGIIKKIGQQKDRLIMDIKKKFAQMYDNIKLAEKKAFEDVLKNFKIVYQKITSLIKQENDSQKKYKQWEQKCIQLFEKAQICMKIQEKAGYFFGGPLQICGEGDTLLNRIETKVDSNILAIQALISKIKIVENITVSNSIFNYINVFVQDNQQIDIFGHVPLQSLSPREPKIDESKRLTRLQFSPDPLLNDIVAPVTPKKRSSSKERSANKLSEKRSSGKVSNQSERGSVEKLVQEFCERDNLDTLDLTGYSLNDSQVFQILKYLKPVKRIKGLKLVKNKLTNDGLCKILEYIPAVTNLNMAFNQLSDDSLMSLLRNRQKVPMLRIINLSNNRINERKAKSDIEQLKKQGIIVTI